MPSKIKYPFLNLIDSVSPLKEEIADAVARVINSGRYIGGEECDSFEKKLSEITTSPYVVGVSNGLDALRLIFRAYIELGKLQPGDEVIVPANTYIASVLAVTDMGLKPVFVEPDIQTLNIDWNLVEAALTDKVRAVMTVHLYGRVSWDDAVCKRLKDRGILLIEDNAQAIGAISATGVPTGALGDAAAFSFYPTKNIGALGDAGAVATPHKEVAEMVRALANYGSDRRYHNIVCGYNCRLDPIQAAALSVKLNYLQEENERRRGVAQEYLENIKNEAVSLPAKGAQDMVWHQFVVRCEDRKSFTEHLTENGVGWDIHYAVPPHLQPCYKEYAELHLPVTVSIADSVVSLPISPSTTQKDASEIARIINSFS